MLIIYLIVIKSKNVLRYVLISEMTALYCVIVETRSLCFSLTHNIFFNTFEKKPQFLNYNISEIMDNSECIFGDVTKLNYLYIFFIKRLCRLLK